MYLQQLLIYRAYNPGLRADFIILPGFILNPLQPYYAGCFMMKKLFSFYAGLVERDYHYYLN
ncbi:MAG: hypothetical protein CVV49_10385 [Spirochaetae bacterium HGW-Spirochaetae-5]|nr:MAG: hypothetical protein CVV49_10385 [Spirochaetae bacterium HGW-Spirochaetae-5]